MTQYAAGTRLELPETIAAARITAGRGDARLAAAALTTCGDERTVEVRQGGDVWDLPIDRRPGASTLLVVYMTDDAQHGRVEDRSPIGITVGGASATLAPQKSRHGAVIVGEIYHRAGRPVLRVRGDGYAHGIRSLCRREGFPADAFDDRGSRRDRSGTIGDPWEDHVQSPGRQPGSGSAVVQSPGRQTGSGSGVVVAPEHVVTNAHVVAGSRRRIVHLGGRTWNASVICVDEAHDLALLAVPGLDAQPLAFRNPGETYLGEPVTAAGYPLRDVLNADPKITHGNISGMRGQGGDVAVFQFTAPIASGSSGGAVTDTRGRMVGIVSSTLAHETMRRMGAASENVSFAIKASLAMEMLVAAGIDGHAVQNAQEAAEQPAQVSRRIQRGVVAIVLE